VASILLIEDDEPVRASTAALLRLAGYSVETAEDGKTGLTIYQANRHDLVITDILMPDMDGLELIGRLNKMDSGPRVIAISGDSIKSIPVYLPVAKHLGVERILAKPIEAGVLLRTVADVLAEPALPRNKKI
jgi:sigma-B regulation protein RsbU (phosphoserine phosphatase)